MDLLYFSDVSQLDYVLDSNPKLLTQMRPITGDMVVSFELERLGIEYIDEWDLIEPEEIEANWNASYVLSTTWWNESISSTKYGIESLSESAQQDCIYPFQTCLNARTVYDRLFNIFSIEKISGYFLPSVAVIRTGPVPTSRAVRSVSEAVLFFMADKRGIPVVKLRSTYPLSLGRAHGLGGGATYSYESGQIDISKSINKESLLIFKDGLRHSEYVSIMAILKSLSDVVPISLSQDDLEFAVQFKHNCRHIENRLLPFRRALIGYSESYIGNYPEIFSNPYLYFQFDRITLEMEQAADYGDVFDTYLDVLKPSAVIFGFESLTMERVLVGLAQARKIFTIGMLHGGVMPKMAMRGVTGRADAILVWNNFDMQAISTYGNAMLRLAKIGCVQYQDSYFQYKKKLLSQQLNQTKLLAKRRLKQDVNKPLIMIVTAEVNTGFAASVAHSHKHRNAIRGVISLVDARPDLQFIIKPHPSYDYYELYRRLLSDERPNLKFLEQISLSELIEASDICLMVNYCTTASLEAMLKRIPVVYLNNAVYPLSDWQDNLLETGISRVRSTLELESTIDMLLKNSEAKQKALDEADKQIKEILGISESTSFQQFLDYITHELVSRNAGQSQDLSSAQSVLNFLNSNLTQEKSRRFNELTKNHSGEYLMYVFSHLAGIHNLGYSALFNTFQLFHDCVENQQLATWSKARWLLIPAYISGCIDGDVSSGNVNFKFRFLATYLLRPQKFISSPAWFRRAVIKHVIQRIFGRKSFAITRIIHKIRKSYFGFIR